jgi:hypothetical protein
MVALYNGISDYSERLRPAEWVALNNGWTGSHRAEHSLVSAFDGSDRQRLPDALTEHMFDYIIALVQE